MPFLDIDSGKMTGNKGERCNNPCSGVVLSDGPGTMRGEFAVLNVTDWSNTVCDTPSCCSLWAVYSFTHPVKKYWSLLRY